MSKYRVNLSKMNQDQSSVNDYTETELETEQRCYAELREAYIDLEESLAEAKKEIRTLKTFLKQIL